MSSLERRVDQALASGTADLKLVSDKIAEIINELIESEAYGQLNVVFNRILMDNSQHQVSCFAICCDLVVYQLSTVRYIM